MNDFEFNSFRSVGESVHEEEARRRASAERVLTFGVNFLDSALGGVFDDDLVLIGAKTGAGKTQLATCIAIANAAMGKRVHYFALEASKYEIERRLKYSLIAQMLRKDDVASGRRNYLRLNFMDWYRCKLGLLTDAYEQRAADQIAEQYKSLHVFYKKFDFTGQDFVQMATSVQDQTDLLILDHLHYVDSDDANENRGYKDVVKRIRDTALLVNKPVVVIAHLRKGDAKSERLIPDIEDFHGTSDVPKISTKAVMLGPAKDRASPEPGTWPTYFAAVKCRVDGSRTKYVGLVNFDIRTGRYDEEFTLGKVEKQEFIEVTGNQLPAWAIPAEPHQRSFE